MSDKSILIYVGHVLGVIYCLTGASLIGHEIVTSTCFKLGCMEDDEGKKRMLLTPSFAYSLLKDGTKFMLGRVHRRSAADNLALRQKWKPQFEDHIAEVWHQRLRQDVIIRDMKRMDHYPDVEAKRGISPWFRVGLIDTYHRGILVGLSLGGLIPVAEKPHWRFAGQDQASQEKITAMLVGHIAYEDITEVDWRGDGIYSYPHIYCLFSHKGQPYEHLTLRKRQEVDGMRPYYSELASYKEVIKLSKRQGITSFV